MHSNNLIKFFIGGSFKKLRALIPTTIALVIALCCFTETSAEPRHIHFAPGSDSTDIIGAVSSETSYVLRAKKDQLMTVELTASKNRFLLAVTGPDGNKLKNADFTGKWTGVLPETGTYLITISKTRSDDTDSAPFVLTVRIPAQEAGVSTGEKSPKITGLYSAANGSLSAELQEDGSVRFYLSAFYRDHFGEVCAEIKPTGNTLEYRQDDCVIQITFGGDWVFVDQLSTDAECGFGANVTSTDVYKLVNRDKPDFSLCP